MSLEAAAVTIRGFLFADVFADLLQLETHRGHRVSTGPEVLAREIPLFATQAGHRYGALPFQKSDHRGHRILRRDRDAHVHRSGSGCPSMIWHSFCRANAWNTSTNLRRAWPTSTLRRRLGTNTT